jgi:hypothetical protein
VDLLTERQASILSRSSVKMYRSPPPVVTTFASILPRPFAGLQHTFLPHESKQLFRRRQPGDHVDSDVAEAS